MYTYFIIILYKIIVIFYSQILKQICEQKFYET